jgi:hypothetical protein
MVVVFAGAFALEKAIDKRIDNQNEIKKSRYRYYAKPYLMTARENEFFKLLNDIFGAKWFVIPQVHLSSLLTHIIAVLSGCRIQFPASADNRPCTAPDADSPDRRVSADGGNAQMRRCSSRPQWTMGSAVRQTAASGQNCTAASSDLRQCNS